MNGNTFGEELAIGLISIIALIIILTLPLSMITALSVVHPCESKGRYLPVTYLVCLIDDPIK